MKKYRAWILVIAFLSLLFFYGNSTSALPSIKIGGVKLKTELAKTVETREQGLSGRAKLPDDSSMLFIFEEPGLYKFWMKDMTFPIDMIWISDGMRVVYIKKDARPEQFPEVYDPGQNSRYVLEVNSGFADKHNLQVGDAVEFNHIPL